MAHKFLIIQQNIIQILTSLLSFMSEQKEYSKFGQTFISYGSYHHNLVNKIIHIICIPIITATFLALLTYVPVHFQLAGYDIGAFHIFIALSLLYYLNISVGAMLIMGAAFVLGTLAWIRVFANSKPEEIRNAIIILNVIGWGFQFIGHGFFEKRKPALLDNVFQILSAPLFVIIELFDLLGLRTSEINLWKQEIEKNVAEFKSRQKSN